MIRFLEAESRERRYVQQGRRKAIRDTRAAFGRPFREDVLQEAAEEFSYPDWLRGSASVRRITRADVWDELQSCNLPEELAEIAPGCAWAGIRRRERSLPKHIPERDWRYYAWPLLECLNRSPRR